MSLVGNLEDLSLGDILQIISLSQKSGVLVLQSGQGTGRIVFRDGLVKGACVKGRTDDLRGILVGGEFIGAPEFDAAAALASARGASLETTLARETELGRERIDALVREAIEAAILEMFVWQKGDFSFDVRSETHPEDPQLSLPTGLNAQYLSMEGMRLRDERAREPADGAAVEPDALDLDLSAEEMFGVAPSEPGPAPATGSESDETELEEGVLEAAEVLIPAPEASASDISGREAADIVVETVLTRQDPFDEPILETAPLLEEPGPSVGAEWTGGAALAGLPDGSGEAGQPRVVRTEPIVVIEPDVAVLEWVKGVLRDEFSRVHLFQQAEQGLSRIRQYVVRGERPVVLISTATEVDPLSGIHGLGDFVKRLKVQAPGLRVLGLKDETNSEATAPNGLDGLIARPPRKNLRAGTNRGEGPEAQAFAQALARVLGHPGQSPPSRSRPGGGPANAAGLAQLKEVTDRLREASSRGTILPVVIEYAAELFSRVAVLLVRDQQILLLAGRALPALEGPDGVGAAISLAKLQDGWVGRVLATRRSTQGAPEEAGDRALLAHLGLAEARLAYVGPIESGGSVIALVCGLEASEEGGRMPDTSGLEVVLHHAGLALDRAALERALAEEEHGSTPSGSPGSRDRRRG